MDYTERYKIGWLPSRQLKGYDGTTEGEWALDSHSLGNLSV